MRTRIPGLALFLLAASPFAVNAQAADVLLLGGHVLDGAGNPWVKANIAVFDEPAMTDRATYADPHQYSEGTVHVLVNGTFALRDGVVTGELAGRPIPRGGS